MTIATAYEVSTFAECIEANPDLIGHPAWLIARLLEERLAIGPKAGRTFRPQSHPAPEPALIWDEDPERWDGLA